MTKSGMQEKLHSVYLYHNEFIEENGFPPSVREICSHLDIRSTATAYCYLEKLEKNGLIRKSKSKNRAIEIVNKDDPSMRMIRVPLIGQVTAGQPIFAYENMEGYYPLPQEFFRDEEYFMLKVKGESMIEAGIFDGDKIIVKKQKTAENGDIVVALIDDEEATVKRFFKKTDYYVLHPENIYMKDIVVDQLEILGIVQGLLRTKVV